MNEERAALLHKSAKFVIPQPQAKLRHRRRYSRGRAQSGKLIKDSGTDLQFGDLAVEVTRHDTFTK